MAKKDKPTGYRMKVRGVPADRLSSMPQVGREYEITGRVRIKGKHSEEMATDGMRDDVIMQLLELELGEVVESRPNDPNQTTIEDAGSADTDAGDFG